MNRIQQDSPWQAPLLAVGLAVFLHLVFMGLSGVGFTWENVYNSYSIQAAAWLQGHLDVGENRPWLELALYQGKYYVSFPPFPSYVLLPFAFFFGENTPDVAIALGVMALGVGTAARLAGQLGQKPPAQMALAVFLYCGTAVWQITVDGSVWFLAQNLSLTLTLLALYHSVKGRRGWGLFFLSCAVGCRPFQICFVPLCCLLLCQTRQESWSRRLAWLVGSRPWVYLPALALGCSYMALNLARFGSPWEFGHNYLPEFVGAPQGQFSLSYVGQNLWSLVRLPTVNPETGVWEFPMFDGMNVFLAFPILGWILYRAARVGKGWLSGGRDQALLQGLGWACLLGELLLLLCHKTMGGHHYGNRYVADLLPGAFALLCAQPPLEEKPIDAWVFLVLALGGGLLSFNGVLAYFAAP